MTVKVLFTWQIIKFIMPKTKHMDVRFHMIRELVAFSQMLLTSDNATNMFTKTVTIDKFKHYFDLINVSRC